MVNGSDQLLGVVLVGEQTANRGHPILNIAQLGVVNRIGKADHAVADANGKSRGERFQGDHRLALKGRRYEESTCPSQQVVFFLIANPTLGVHPIVFAAVFTGHGQTEVGELLPERHRHVHRKPVTLGRVFATQHQQVLLVPRCGTQRVRRKKRITNDPCGTDEGFQPLLPCR